jgi:molybdopterin-guanine dinucleotide biosynthesis protein A
MKPLGVILAGGRSMRMGGQDKAMLLLAGRPMIAHVADRLAPQVERSVINANGDPSRFAGLGLPVIADTIEGYAGPLAGVLAGLTYSLEAAGGRDIVTVPADTPFFPSSLVDVLLEAHAKHAAHIALAASPSGTHSAVGLWPVSLVGELTAYLRSGGRKVSEWADRHRPAIASFAALDVGGRHIDPFFNVNRPEDLAEAQSYAELLA